jgi:anti-sigma B factor antagonist
MRFGGKMGAVGEQELTVTVESMAADGPAWPMVRVSGEIDIQTSPILEEQLQNVLTQGHSSVVVDLEGVTFLDSTGLSVLIVGLKQCQAAGGELHLVSPRPNVRKVLEVTGLTEAFHVDDSAPTDPPD